MSQVLNTHLGQRVGVRIGLLQAATVCVACLMLTPAVAAAEGPVVVNGSPIASEAVAALESYYRTPISAGRYWYDPLSGAWGFEGGPIVGQMAAGLRLGGPLRADASRGNTGVFVNGRELTGIEVLGLQQACRTAVYRGRYWVNAQGVGGFENGPPFFNLSACGAQGNSPRGSSTRTYCDSGGNCSSHGLWGWISTTH